MDLVECPVYVLIRKKYILFLFIFLLYNFGENVIKLNYIFYDCVYIKNGRTDSVSRSLRVSPR